MKHHVRISAVGRYRHASSFLSDLRKLKAFRNETGPALLENLEELGLLRPRVRVSWPDPVARRFRLETHDRVKELHDPVEPDGPRMDAAAELWTALRDAGSRSLTGKGHPFDAPKPEWREFLQTPDQQSFVSHRDRRVRVSSDAEPDLYDSDNIQDFYSSWQLLAAAEIADMGIHIRINMADNEIAERVCGDIREGRWPGGRATETFAPVRALRGFGTHEAGLDAIEWSSEEEDDRISRLLQGLGGGRIVLNDEQIAAEDEIRRTVAREACTRFGVGEDDLVECCKFLAGRWCEWSGDGRPLIADVYKIFLAAAVRLLQIRFEMSFDAINEAVGFQRGGPPPMLEVIWPDWHKEQIDRCFVRRTCRKSDSGLSESFSGMSFRTRSSTG